MSVINNAELVKRISRLAKQNQDLEEHIKDLEKLKRSLLRVLMRPVMEKGKRDRLNSIWRQFFSLIFTGFPGLLKEWIHHLLWMNLMR
jgi:hypothetical protein